MCETHKSSNVGNWNTVPARTAGESKEEDTHRGLGDLGVTVGTDFLKRTGLVKYTK
jgi:hypothetical protein